MTDAIISMLSREAEEDIENLKPGEKLTNAQYIALQLIKKFPESRDSALLSFPSFEMQTDFIGGMSGGSPSLTKSELCGLVCSGYENTPVAYRVVL